MTTYDQKIEKHEYLKYLIREIDLEHNQVKFIIKCKSSDWLTVQKIFTITELKSIYHANNQYLSSNAVLKIIVAELIDKFPGWVTASIRDTIYETMIIDMFTDTFYDLCFDLEQ